MKRNLFYYIVFLIGFTSFAQNNNEIQSVKSKEISKKYTHKGNDALKNDQPIQAEVDYRNAIAKNKDNGVAQYNLGTMYYKQKSYDEAFTRLKNASTSGEMSNEEKHQIFHNIGNTFMQEKAYDKAVQAYKEALRNNPTDEQTRYNLAVAQDLLKKNPPKPEENKDQNKNNQQNQDNKDQQNNQNNKDKQDEKDKNNDKNKEKDNQNKQNQDENKQNQDKDQGKESKAPNQDGKDKNENNERKGQNRPSSLSPQQMERILEAMNNEDQKTQEKINAQKVKGNRSKSEKDW
ncbi:tetratricopeptide repeat protein [Capnocytophaga felis]|uniref:Uncharacterized protein n=1 Tax=Capnocytophaga felis TaxID=2267611 RepID=A0A5M4B9L8_9FLAO|nr:tetratricopeptide repeat protein [Capnocytophaga felis]GET45887.1 hypothetical protein RCZ01_11890 [Capnocytophaga felis]GET49260.1 hypothetical protein RCZ02_20910 [Capnocytophaga felis]